MGTIGMTSGREAGLARVGTMGTIRVARVASQVTPGVRPGHNRHWRDTGQAVVTARVTRSALRYRFTGNCPGYFVGDERGSSG